MGFNLEAAEQEYIFECGCGELYRSSDAAWNCRKCRTDLSDADFFDRKVKNTQTCADVPLEWSGA